MSTIAVNGVELEVTVHGHGSTVVLVHGFPHTGIVWAPGVEALRADHRVVVPDLRGFGASTPTAEGLDADTLSRDLEGLLLAVGDGPATPAAIDAGVPPAFLLGLRRPDLLSGLVLVESTLGTLPGAEDIFASGPPWWFGFHQVPGLAERVLHGNEAEYVGWFYDQSTRNRGVRPDLRAALGEAFAAPGALARTLEIYRAMPTSARQIADAVRRDRLTVPTVAVGAAPVGRALEGQLRALTDDLTAHLVADCGHIVPVDRPEALIALLTGNYR